MPYPDYTKKEIRQILKMSRSRLKIIPDFWYINQFFFRGISKEKIIKMIKTA